jgi:hypothetical protein
MLRDRGCAFPGCTHGRFLHGHHIRHWLHGGATSLGKAGSRLRFRFEACRAPIA